MIFLGRVLPILMALVAVLAGCNETQTNALTQVSEEVNKQEEQDSSLFNIKVKDYRITQNKFKKNQFLADVLLKVGISYPKIDRIVKEMNKVFDVRDLRAGKPYFLYEKADTTAKLDYFVYQPNVVDYLVVDLRDSVVATMHQKPVTTAINSVSGLIESSLFESLIKAGANTSLAVEMAEVYAWSIDFYKIQKGDQFKVIYEERMVDGKSISIGKIYSAVFKHFGQEHFAFSFSENGRADYYDEDAKSLRRAFLKSPLKFGRITSSFARRRFHPVQKRWKAHLGTDYAAPRGTPILAVCDGRITEARFKKYNGNYVKIKHNGTYTTQYLHMSKIKKGIRPGKFVKQGDVIGYVGSTGLATGPHVCFRFWKNGKQVNHKSLKLPSSKELAQQYRADFKVKRDSMMQLLNQIEIAGLKIDSTVVKPKMASVR